MKKPTDNRRDFLTGKAGLRRVQDFAGREFDNGIGPERTAPVARATTRIATRAMACEFVVVLNPGDAAEQMPATDALDLLPELEQQMSAWREDSELAVINRTAHENATAVEPRLFELFQMAANICRSSDHAFDPTSRPLVKLWRDCRDAGRVPTRPEVDELLQRIGIDHVILDADAKTIRFAKPGIEFDLGGIGKGYALDRQSEVLLDRGFQDYLLHGGHSSLLARGNHVGTMGWPVGIGNPLFTNERLGTLILRDVAMATSGSNIQFFRHEGRRYGHILDPRTGWPVREMLSVTVLAPTAAQADALSTAFFVLGVENAQRYCDTLTGVGAILVPFPESGRQVEPVVLGIPEDDIFWNEEQVSL